MVTVEDIIAVIRKTNISQTAIDFIDPDVTFFEQGIDSLEALTIVMRIEEEFDVNIPDGEMEELDTISKLVNFINLQRSERIP